MTDTQTVEPFLPMPGDVHPSLPPDSWSQWSGMAERGAVLLAVSKPPLVADPSPPDPWDVSYTQVQFTLRKAFGSLDGRFGGYWWWVWWSEDGRYVAAPLMNWAPSPLAEWWGSGAPLPG